MRAVSVFVGVLLCLAASACSPLSREDEDHLQQALTVDEFNRIICMSAPAPCPTRGDDSEEIETRDFIERALTKPTSFRLIPNPDQKNTVRACWNGWNESSFMASQEYREFSQHRRVSWDCSSNPRVSFGNYDDAIFSFDDKHVRPFVEYQYYPRLRPGADVRVLASIGTSAGVDIIIDAHRESAGTATIVFVRCRPRSDGLGHPLRLQLLACFAALDGMPCSIWCSEPANDEKLIRKLRS
jgi:hypothetical protein